VTGVECRVRWRWRRESRKGLCGVSPIRQWVWYSIAQVGFKVDSYSAPESSARRFMMCEAVRLQLHSENDGCPKSLFFKRVVMGDLEHARAKALTQPIKMARDVKSYQVRGRWRKRTSEDRARAIRLSLWVRAASGGGGVPAVGGVCRAHRYRRAHRAAIRGAAGAMRRVAAGVALLAVTGGLYRYRWLDTGELLHTAAGDVIEPFDVCEERDLKSVTRGDLLDVFVHASFPLTRSWASWPSWQGYSSEAAQG
jgi:hypothetical protein